MTEKRKQSPHYIPELDPENHAETCPNRTLRSLLFEWGTWGVLALGASPALVGAFADGLPFWLRLKLILVGVMLSFVLILLFIRTNRPKP